MTPWEQRLDQIDASVFSSDMMFDADRYPVFKEMVARWSKAIAEHEACDASERLGGAAAAGGSPAPAQGVHDPVRAALEELVALKALRARIDAPTLDAAVPPWPSLDARLAARIDYDKRKAVAWETARTALREAPRPAPHSANAVRYRRLRLLGAVPVGSEAFGGGAALTFEKLDKFVDLDILMHPERGDDPFGEDETDAELALRRIAAALSVGGYNAPLVDVKAYERKILEECRELSEIAVKSLTASLDDFPMQPIERDAMGVVRFRKNRIVDAILTCASRHGYGLGEIAMGDFTAAEQMQVAQLIGYSVSGYSDLGYASADSVKRSRAAADALASTDIDLASDQLKAS